jgi:hypothetical protein
MRVTSIDDTGSDAHTSVLGQVDETNEHRGTRSVPGDLGVAGAAAIFGSVASAVAEC